MQEVFHAAAGLPAEHQPAFLDGACAGDVELRHQVERLLNADRVPNPDWQVPALEAFARHGGVEPAPDYTARSFGPYRVIERIGSGGMGVVYKAVREDNEYRQTVAIKILPGGFDTPDRVDRFRHERQILANLVHPNIARLLDGGTTEEGLPYLVLEFVEGLPMDRFAKQTNPPVERRLRLFRRIADAVQFAHRNLVVHCDLKPANILVEPDGTPKLLDFGISQLLEEGRLSRTATAPLMTPEYASPEQVLAKPVTTATDVYALGVLLCVLLTGRRPYESAVENRADFTRAVCESAVNTQGLPADLANIVAMATRKEPERRYSSVEQFSADIGRYMEHRPVLARRDTFRYRAGKYLRRNAIALSLAVLAITIAGSAITESLLQSRRASRRFDEIRGLSHYLMFDIYDGLASLPGSTPLRKAVVAQALRYLDRLAADAADDPDLAAEIADSYLRLGMVLGHPYSPNLGDTQGAIASMNRGRAILEPLVRKYPERTHFASSLATIYRREAIVLTRADQPVQSVEYARQAVAIMQTSGRSVPFDATRSLDLAGAQMTAGIVEDWRATVHSQMPSFEAAISWFRQTVHTLESMPRGNASDAARRTTLIETVYQNMGDVQRNFGDATGDRREYEAALASVNESLSVARSLPPEDAITRRDVADCLATKGRTLGPLGRFDEADQAYQQAQPEFERLAAIDRDNMEAQKDLADLYNFRGETLALAGRTADAAHWVSRAIPIYEIILKHDPGNREIALFLQKARTRMAVLATSPSRR
jgi:tetratricopeptide (TPR) repeat protein